MAQLLAVRWFCDEAVHIDFSCVCGFNVTLHRIFRKSAKEIINVMKTSIFIRLAVLAAVVATALGCSKTPASIKELPSAYVRMDSVKVHYKTSGRGDKSVVFVHGFGCDMYSWERQYEGLKGDKGLRMIFIDLPGFG